MPVPPPPPNVGGGHGYRPWKLCGAVGRVEYNGGTVIAVCTRFSGHLERGKKEPLKHFDERTRRSWYEEVQPVRDENKKIVFKELLEMADPPVWECPYKKPVPPLIICQGYHREGCDHSCDRSRIIQLRNK